MTCTPGFFVRCYSAQTISDAQTLTGSTGSKKWYTPTTSLLHKLAPTKIVVLPPATLVAILWEMALEPGLI